MVSGPSPELFVSIPRHEDDGRGHVTSLTQNLVFRSSENAPPRASGLEPDPPGLSEFEGLSTHLVCWLAREDDGCPGFGPRRWQPWIGYPSGREVEDSRLYGPGANEAKADVPANLLMIESLREFRPHVRGAQADALLCVSQAHHGVRTACMTPLSEGGVPSPEQLLADICSQLTWCHSQLAEFALGRHLRALAYDPYAASPEPSCASETKVFASSAALQRRPWECPGTAIRRPESCKFEVRWRAVRGDSQDEVEFPNRRVPGSAMGSELAECAEVVPSQPPSSVGVEGSCNAYINHRALRIPAVIRVARGGSTHSLNVYIEFDSLIGAERSHLCFEFRWIGAFS